jgi:hypothetical protein
LYSGGDKSSDATMLGRLTQWVSAKLDVKEDDHLKQRFDALVRS